jgi:hypothetical protein
MLPAAKEAAPFELHVDIDLAAIKEIHRLSITLEDFSTIQSNLKEIEKTGLIPGDFARAVTISLSDLKVVLDILDNPVERMHYLQRRRAIQENWNYLGDELDLLGLYVSTGLNVGAESERVANGVGMSAKSTRFEALDQGMNPKLAR